MMNRWLCLIFVAMTLPACSGEVDVDAHSGSSSGSNGGGGSGNGGSDACVAYQAEPATSVKIQVVNATAAPFYLDDYCWMEGPDGIAIDGLAVVGGDSWSQWSCDNLLADKCQPLDCFGNPPLEIAAGTTYEVSWSGRLPEAQNVVLPDPCRTECAQFEDNAHCFIQRAAAAGEHTLSVRYSDAPEKSFETLELKFNYPTDTVTATIGP